LVAVHAGADFTVVLYEEMIDNWKEEHPLKEKIEKCEDSWECLHRWILEKANKIIRVECKEIHNQKEVTETLTEYGDAFNAIGRASIHKFTCLGKKRNKYDKEENGNDDLPKDINRREHATPIDETDRVFERNTPVFFGH
jgi:hypothetical protein